MVTAYWHRRRDNEKRGRKRKKERRKKNGGQKKKGTREEEQETIRYKTGEVGKGKYPIIWKLSLEASRLETR